MNNYILKIFCCVMIFCFLHMDNAIAEDEYEDADYENSDQSNTAEDRDEQKTASINQSDAQNRLPAGNEDEQVKEKVISVVDNMLRISRQKEMTVNDPKIKKLLKEQDITKQMTQLREQMRILEKTIDTHYTQASKDKNNYAKYAEQGDAKKTKNSKDKALSKSNKIRRHHSKHKAKLDVYTVKQNKRNLSNKYKPNYISVRTNNVKKQDSIKKESNYLKANDSSCGCSMEI